MEAGGLVLEGREEEGVGSLDGAGVVGVEGEGEGAVEDVGERLEGCGRGIQVQEKNGCDCLELWSVNGGS